MTGVAWASIPDGNCTIHGCYAKHGALRVIDTQTQTCHKGEQPLSWNQTGPQGPQGPQGPRGPQGPPGLGEPVYLAARTVADEDHENDVVLASFANGLRIVMHCGRFDPFAGNQGGNTASGVFIEDTAWLQGEHSSLYGFNSNYPGAGHQDNTYNRVDPDAPTVDRGQTYCGFDEGTAVVNKPRTTFGQDERGLWYSLVLEVVVDQNAHVTCETTGEAIPVSGTRTLPPLIPTP